MEEKPRRVNWRNVFLLCCLGSPLLYYVANYVEPIVDAPGVLSSEGREIIREYVAIHFPTLAWKKVAR